MIDPSSTVLRRSARLENKTKRKYLLAKLSLAVIGACEVAKNHQIFLTKENQQIQIIKRHFYGTLNNFDLMVFE